MQNRRLIDLIFKFQEELSYYTHPGVQPTAHQVGAPATESWTRMMALLGLIKLPKSADRYIELERTVTSLYSMCLSMDGAQNYAAFTQTQTEKDKLSRDNYENHCRELKDLTSVDDNLNVLTHLMTYSDLGKSPKTRELAAKFDIDVTLDTDDLMLEILNLEDEKVISILPSFKDLSANAKNMIRKAYPIMQACFGHIYFLENGQRTFEIIAKGLLKIENIDERQKILSLVFMAQFYDGIGSQGQQNINGSVTCVDSFYEGYMMVRGACFHLEKRLRETNIATACAQALNWFLNERSLPTGLSPLKFETYPDYEFVMRLACTIRIYNVEMGFLLRDKFNKLKPEYKALLTDQLSFNTSRGIQSFVRPAHYIATAAQNISREAFKNGEIDKALDLALNVEICFAMMIKEINENPKYAAIAQDPHLPLSFGKLAFRATEPGFFNPETFDAGLAKWALPRPTPMGKVKNLIFDLGHVFIRIDTSRDSVFAAFSELARKQGKNLSAEYIKEIFTSGATDAAVSDFHHGKMSIADFRKIIRIHLHLDESVSDKDFDDAWNASIYAAPETVKRRLAIIDELGMQGYSIYLLSNNNEIHRVHTKTHYEGLHWGQYFFKQYYSNETGLYKPDPKGFEQIVKENLLKKDETVFFDDVTKYVDAAWEYGIRARKFTVDDSMDNLLLMIESINQVERVAAANEGTVVTRDTTLKAYAFNFMRQLAVESKARRGEEKQDEAQILQTRPQM